MWILPTDGRPIHVVHYPGLGNHRLARVQLDLHELNVVADDLVVDLVALHGRTR
jgi:hypothetical protein